MNVPGQPRATGWELPAVVAIAVFGLVCLLYVLAFLFSLCCGRCGAGPAGGQLREENEEATFHPSSPPGAPDLEGGASAPPQAF